MALRLWCDPYNGGTSTTLTAPVSWVDNPLHTAATIPQEGDPGTTTVTCTSQAQFFSALSAATDGDIIVLDSSVGGSFTVDATSVSQMTIGGSGTEALPIVIKQNAGDEWFTSGGDPCKITDYGFHSVGKSHIVYQNLWIEDIASHGDGHRGIRFEGTAGTLTEGLTVIGCKIRNCYSSAVSVAGVDGDPGDYNRMSGIRIESNLLELFTVGGTNEGVTIKDGVTDVDICFNILREGDPAQTGGDEGIDLKNGVWDARIYGNICYDLADKAIYLDGGGGTGHTGTPFVNDVDIYDNLLIGPFVGVAMVVATEGPGTIERIRIWNNIIRDLEGGGEGLRIWRWRSGDESEWDTASIFDDIQIRQNTVINADDIGIQVDRTARGGSPAVTNVTIEGNLVYNSADPTHDIQLNPGAPSSANHAKDSGGVTFDSSGDPLLIGPGSVTSENLLHEPTASSPALNPGTITEDAFLVRDFYGRLRPTGEWDFGAVQYYATEPADQTIDGATTVTIGATFPQGVVDAPFAVDGATTATIGAAFPTGVLERGELVAGGWGQLFRSNWVDPEAAAMEDTPRVCPHSGDMLQTRHDGTLVCPFDGWTPA